jgi:predicted permease
MALWSEILRRAAWLGRRSRFERELDDEMRFHIESRADELEQEGLSRDEALLKARREFGSSLRARESTRSAWQFRWFEDLGGDLRYAAQAFRRNPAFAFTAICCLALGVGANTTMFSVAMELLFSEPSCRDPHTLVRVSVGGNDWALMDHYRFLRDAQIFDGLAGINIGMVVNWRDGSRSYKLAGTHVTNNFFEVTGIPVAMGRPIERGETGVTVITYGFWRRRLGADPNVLGRRLVLDGKPYTVVGVLPRDHRMLVGFGMTPDLYLTKDASDVTIYGRLPLGMSRPAAFARLKPVLREMDRVFPDPNRKWKEGARLSGVGGLERLELEGGAGMSVAAFLGMLVLVTGLVLLIACANMSSLLLARASGRSQELAIRTSLGGSRGRIVRQLLAESLLLALCGTAAGVALNLVLTRLISGVRIPTPLPIEALIQPDWRLLAYSIGITVLVTIVAGLAPALKSTRAGIGAALKEHERQLGPGRWTLRNALVAGQLAVSIVLLSAGLAFLRSLLHATSFNAGFDTAHTVLASIRPVPESSTAAKFDALTTAGIERLRMLPDVESVSLAQMTPLNPFRAFFGRRVEFRPDTSAQAIRTQYNADSVGPDYFHIMGIPILRGRAFVDSDRLGAPAVAILNENLARLLFGHVDAVGHTIRLRDNSDVRVVGVARNSKYVTVGEVNAMALYSPCAQHGSGWGCATFFIRARGAPDLTLRQVDATLSDLDPTLAVETRAMRDVFSWALLPSRVGAGVLGAMALLGLALASVGLYGVLLYAVSRRIGEIGVRVALGATPAAILQMVAGESARLVAAGMAIGLGVAVVAVRPLSMFLVPGVRSTDPANFLVVACALSLVAALATVAPTLRALRVDPAVALRHE